MPKLEIDVPLFRRCCFCLPLRYGLCALGKLKLFMFLMVFTVSMDDFTDSPLPWFFVLEIVFNVLLIAATLIKKEKLYQIYYKCAILELVVMIILFVLTQVVSGQRWAQKSIPPDRSTNPGHEMDEFGTLMIFDCLLVSFFLLQVYITMLVRSILIKIREAAISTNNTVEVESQSPEGKSVEVIEVEKTEEV